MSHGRPARPGHNRLRQRHGMARKSGRCKHKVMPAHRSRLPCSPTAARPRRRRSMPARVMALRCCVVVLLCFAWSGHDVYQHSGQATAHRSRSVWYSGARWCEGMAGDSGGSMVAYVLWVCIAPRRWRSRRAACPRTTRAAGRDVAAATTSLTSCCQHTFAARARGG